MCFVLPTPPFVYIAVYVCTLTQTKNAHSYVLKFTHLQQRLLAVFALSMASAQLSSLGKLPMPVPGAATSESCDVQVLRSVGPWSLGCSTECSIQAAWIDAINKSEEIFTNTNIYHTQHNTAKCKC
jgi:hypothetical protein